MRILITSQEATTIRIHDHGKHNPQAPNSHLPVARGIVQSLMKTQIKTILILSGAEIL